MILVILLLLVSLIACNDELPVQNENSNSKTDTIYKNSQQTTNFKILSFAPLEAKYNDTITLIAKGVGKSKYNIKVKISEVEAKVTSLENQDSLQIIKFLVPHLEQNGFVSIEFQNERAFSSQEFILKSSLYIYDFEPKKAYQNQKVTIFGNNFDKLDLPNVLIANVSAEILSLNRTQIQIRMPNCDAESSFITVQDDIAKAHSMRKIEYLGSGHFLSSADKYNIKINDTVTFYGINLLKKNSITKMQMADREIRILMNTMDSIKVIIDASFNYSGVYNVALYIDNVKSEGNISLNLISEPYIAVYSQSLFVGDTLQIYGRDLTSIEDATLKLFINNVEAEILSIKSDLIKTIIQEKHSSGRVSFEYGKYKDSTFNLIKIIKNRPTFEDFSPDTIVEKKTFELVISGDNFDENASYKLYLGSYGFSPKAVYKDKIIYVVPNFLHAGEYYVQINYYYSYNKIFDKKLLITK